MLFRVQPKSLTHDPPFLPTGVDSYCKWTCHTHCSVLLGKERVRKMITMNQLQSVGMLYFHQLLSLYMYQDRRLYIRIFWWNPHTYIPMEYTILFYSEYTNIIYSIYIHLQNSWTLEVYEDLFRKYTNNSCDCHER